MSRLFNCMARVFLCALAALLVYRFEWTGLRTVYCTIVTAANNLLGMPAYAASQDTMICNGSSFRFLVGCTLIDVYCSSIPLIWDVQASLRVNGLKLVKYFFGLNLLNIIRLEIGFELYFKGVSWTLAHEAFAGVTYFLVLIWVLRQKQLWPEPVDNTRGARIDCEENVLRDSHA